MLIVLASEKNVWKTYIMGNCYKEVNRVLRGAIWNNRSQNSRVANRNNNNPSNRNNNIGFRVVSLQLESKYKSQMRCTDGCQNLLNKYLIQPYKGKIKQIQSVSKKMKVD
jgi:hypothetical protein